MRKIVKKLIPRKLFQEIEPFGHLAESVMWNARYGFPARGLKVIGVTGTDGKTTTTTVIWNMLREAGLNVGYMSTIGYGTPNWQKDHLVHMTTVQSSVLMERICEMRADGIEWLVLETTSHALAQNRAWGVDYALAVMTNVGHEHLDYHKTFERYRAAKMKLFKLVDNNSNGFQTGIINADDASAELFASAVSRPITYGVKNGDIRATRISTASNGSSYSVKFGESKLRIKTSLPGGFNVSNTLAAVCVGGVLGLSDEQIVRGIAATKGVEGRMTSIDEGQDFAVIVDFAHTPDSFDKLLSDMKSQLGKGGRLIVMFGSAGRRDESKRGLQGALAGKYADVVVVTEEDDRDIDGRAIMEQIALGAQSEGKTKKKDLFLVHDRVEAIAFALGKAKKGDIVMLLGKGHEKTIERADGEHLWDEMGTARGAIIALRAPRKKSVENKKAAKKAVSKPATKKSAAAAKPSTKKKTTTKSAIKKPAAAAMSTSKKKVVASKAPTKKKAVAKKKVRSTKK